MFGGFDPSEAQAPYFERRRGVALAAAIFVHAAVAGVIAWIELDRSHEEIVDVVLDEPVVENLEIEEEPEVEEEPEPEPEPQPKPRSEIQNVTKQTEKISETAVAPERVPEPEAEPEVEKPKAPVEQAEPEAKPKPKSEGIGDRTVPRPMPADGTPPKPLKSNAAPAYPESLRQQNITGVIKLKLNIHMDGSVRGMKVLKKQIAGTDDPALIEKAQKLFLKEVVAAVKTWKFEPAKLKGKTITVWWPVTIPFNLN